jgi:succinate--hydroxymethylglutarate CoA-transferase
MGLPELAEDPRFRTNSLRAENRAAIIPILSDILASQTTQHWIGQFTGKGCGVLLLYEILTTLNSELLQVPFWSVSLPSFLQHCRNTETWTTRARINNMQRTFAHPQVEARKLVTEVPVSHSYALFSIYFNGHGSLQHPSIGTSKMVSPAVIYDGQRMKVN